MPDHVHALVEGLGDDSEFLGMMRLWKQGTAFDARRRYGETLWQRGCYERVLRSDEDTYEIARYVITNPVRAGLVTSLLDYPFVGSDTTMMRDLLTG